MNTRTKILDTAKQYVCTDRAAVHGKAEDSFANIAKLWAGYLGIELSSVQVAAMMVLFKIARTKNNPQHQDNWIDICGYAACGAEVAEIATLQKARGFINLDACPWGKGTTDPGWHELLTFKPIIDNPLWCAHCNQHKNEHAGHADTPKPEPKLKCPNHLKGDFFIAAPSYPNTCFRCGNERSDHVFTT